MTAIVLLALALQASSIEPPPVSGEHLPNVLVDPFAPAPAAPRVASPTPEVELENLLAQLPAGPPVATVTWDHDAGAWLVRLRWTLTDGTLAEREDLARLPRRASTKALRKAAAALATTAALGAPSSVKVRR
jgi:hypothetical protein